MGRSDDTTLYCIQQLRPTVMPRSDEKEVPNKEVDEEKNDDEDEGYKVEGHEEDNEDEEEVENGEEGEEEACEIGGKSDKSDRGEDGDINYNPCGETSCPNCRGGRSRRAPLALAVSQSPYGQFPRNHFFHIFLS